MPESRPLHDRSDAARQIRDAIPLRTEVLQKLAIRFTHVVRATVKGNIVIAIVQGFLGGTGFWNIGVHTPVLWGVLMAFLHGNVAHCRNREQRRSG